MNVQWKCNPVPRDKCITYRREAALPTKSPALSQMLMFAGGLILIFEKFNELIPL